MSIELIPGLDFGGSEQVTKDKLSAWIGGVYNLTGTPTAADVGADYPTLPVASTLPSCVTEGTLQFDTTRGQLNIYTRFGFIPVGLTSGGLFTRRFARGGVSAAWYAPLSACLYSFTANTAIGITAYSLGVTEKCYGNAYWGALIGSSSAVAAQWYYRAGALWPTNEKPYSAVTTGVWTLAQSASPLICFGGWGPVWATCATLPYTFCGSSDAPEGLSIASVGRNAIDRNPCYAVGSPSRFGFRAAENTQYVYAYHTYGGGWFGGWDMTVWY